MRRVIRIFAYAFATLLVLAPRFAMAQAPAAPSIQAELLKDWSDLKETILRIANEMPADKYDFKPTPAQQTFGERAVHVASANNRFLATIGGQAPAPSLDAKAAATSKDAAMKAIADSFDWGIALLKEQSDQTLLQPVTAPFIGVSTRARVYTFLMGHTWDIYGQFAVYLRMAGHVPPASQRP